MIGTLIAEARAGLAASWEAWQRFWFTPSLPHTLAVQRILTGMMAAYIHAIWWLRADQFLSPSGWIDADTVRLLHRFDHAWSYLWFLPSVVWAYAHQAVAVAVCLAVAAGFATRLTVPLAWVMSLMVVHRMTGMLFGLDQVVMMLLMYLMLGHSGGIWSVDARLNAKLGTRWWRASGLPASSNTLATRLIQLHLCVIYLFGGVSKLRGDAWWDGSAMWLALASYEYQTIDLTWLGHFPVVLAIVTHMTIFWETFYCALVWPRVTRPWVLGMAVAVHAGIAMFLGMPTFGSMMIVANLAFIRPEFTRHIFQAARRWPAPSA